MPSSQPGSKPATSLAPALLSSTQIGLQRSNGQADTYVPGTVPERLYKRAQMAHENYDDIFTLGIDDFAPTDGEMAAIEAEVDDTALTNAIEAIKKTVRSGRQVKPT